MSRRSPYRPAAAAQQALDSQWLTSIVRNPGSEALWEQQASALFIDGFSFPTEDYVVCGCHLTNLSAMLRTARNDSLIYKITKTVAFSYLAVRSKMQPLMQSAMLRYGRVLTKLRDAIAAPDQTDYGELICSICLMGLHEVGPGSHKTLPEA